MRDRPGGLDIGLEDSELTALAQAKRLSRNCRVPIWARLYCHGR